MRVTYSWLKEYCSFHLSPKELAEALTGVGLVVTEVKPLKGDYCLEIEVTSNRPDCLGVIGVAREVAALTRGALRPPEVDYRPADRPVDFEVLVEQTDLCPRYTARIILGVRVGPSPSWLKERLEAVGLRPVNNIVDITNYVLLEYGQPLHAFDLDALRDKKIVVRQALPGERIEAIDGTRCNLSPDVLVIADGVGPIAIAGVMGGKDTEVREGTVNIVLESARFKPAAVRRASRRFALATESSYRFERGVDPEGVEKASRRAARLIQDIAGGDVLKEVDINPVKAQRTALPLRIQRLNSILGTQIGEAEAGDILSRLGFEVTTGDKGVLLVTIPTFRGDVSREIDLIEEVARIYGYNNIPTNTQLPIQIKQREKSELVEERVRDIMTGWGFNEVITYSIIEDAPVQHFGLFSKEGVSLTIRNPIRAGEDRLRQSLLANLLKTKRYNQDHGVSGVKVFELSRVYLPIDTQKLPEEKTCLALLWEEEGRGAEEGFYELKGIVEGLFCSLSLKGEVQWQQFPTSLFTEERSSRVELEGTPLGILGEVRSEVVRQYDLHYAPCMAEIDFDALVRASSLVPTFKRPPLYPPIVRDLAIIVAEETSWAEVERCVRESGVKYLEAVEFFDLYRGRQIPPGKKGIAFRILFRAPDRTLRNEEADEALQVIIDRLSRLLGVTLRK